MKSSFSPKVVRNLAIVAPYLFGMLLKDIGEDNVLYGTGADWYEYLRLLRPPGG